MVYSSARGLFADYYFRALFGCGALYVYEVDACFFYVVFDGVDAAGLFYVFAVYGFAVDVVDVYGECLRGVLLYGQGVVSVARIGVCFQVYAFGGGWQCEALFAAFGCGGSGCRGWCVGGDVDVPVLVVVYRYAVEDCFCCVCAGGSVGGGVYGVVFCVAATKCQGEVLGVYSGWAVVGEAYMGGCLKVGSQFPCAFDAMTGVGVDGF